MFVQPPLDASPLSSRLALSVGSIAALVAAYKVLRVLSRPSLPAGSHPPRRPPSTHWLLGDMLQVARNHDRYLDWIIETTKACDEKPWLHKAPLMPDMLVVASPSAIDEITRTQSDAFGKGKYTRELVYEIFGDSFFSLDGPEWFHQRKTAVKFFSGRMYREVAMPITRSHVAELLDRLARAQRDQSDVNLTQEFNTFALQTFTELGFGLKIDQIDPMPLHFALEEAFIGVQHRMQKPAWLWKLQRWLNVGHEKKFREATSFARQFVLELVRDSLNKSVTNNTNDSGDGETQAMTLVELFIDAMRNGEGEYSAELLCDLAIMFTLAGRDTSTAVLDWLFYSLYKHPHVEKRIREELWAHVPDLMEGKVQFITNDQAQKLVYLEACIKEVTRLYPAQALSPRQCLSDTVLSDGTFVPKGMGIGLSPYTMARLKSVWGEDAAEFNPDRFIDTTTGRSAVVPQSKFFGFGAGPRSCIGMNLALLELKVMVSAVMSRFCFETKPIDGTPRFSAFVVLAHPLTATVLAAPGRPE